MAGRTSATKLNGLDLTNMITPGFTVRSTVEVLENIILECQDGFFMGLSEKLNFNH